MPLGAGFTHRGTGSQAGLFPGATGVHLRNAALSTDQRRESLAERLSVMGKQEMGARAADQKSQLCLGVSSPRHPAGVQRAGEFPSYETEQRVEEQLCPRCEMQQQVHVARRTRRAPHAARPRGSDRVEGSAAQFQSHEGVAEEEHSGLCGSRNPS